MKKEIAKKNNIKKTASASEKPSGVSGHNSGHVSSKATGKVVSKAAMITADFDEEMDVLETSEKKREEEKAGEYGVELEDADEEHEAAAAGGQGNAAALAAANGHSEISASFKNFRHHPDMENFYRFIFENDLRQEALSIIDRILVDKQQRKVIPKPGKSPH